MISSPTLMSSTPGPAAVLSFTRVNRWNGLSFSNTVSRCPISSSFLPRVPRRVFRFGSKPWSFITT